MAVSSSILDLAALRLSPGEGARIGIDVPIAPVTLGSERYEAAPATVPAQIDVSRMLGGGYAVHMRFAASISGPCMRCLAAAAPVVDVDVREIDRPGAGEELESPYVRDERLDVAAWARDAFLLSAPAQVLCREDCRGLCPICAANLNEEPEGHHHEAPRDRRWAKLSELELE
jgi:DUF177 domain-containing protein